LRTTSHHPTRDELLTYLQHYHARHVSDSRLGTEVKSIARDGSQWRVNTERDSLTASAVVLACGFHAEPVLPKVEGLGEFRGECLHSAHYRRASRFMGRRVLVVGAGNSGADIATDLVHGGADVAWSLREAVFAVPMTVAGVHWRSLYELLPNRLLPVAGRLGFGKLARRAVALGWQRISRTHFSSADLHGVRLADAHTIARHFGEFRPPLTNTAVFELVAQRRLVVRPEVASFTAQEVRFVDHTSESFDAVILATGYAPAALFSSVVDDVRSLRDGPVPAQPGLFVCGSRPELSQIGKSARQIAAQVVRHLTGKTGGFHECAPSDLSTRQT
jgi:cation diffusion facilitator CzcD-associated flavoprotein CzcO